MIKINRQTDYAARVVLALALRSPLQRVQSATIQREMQIPKAFMARIVARLAQVGLVQTFPGRKGGLSLPRPAEQITLLEVLEAFEGPLLLSDCLHPSGHGDCPFSNHCPVRSTWERVQAALAHELAAVHFAGLAAEAQKDNLIEFSPFAL